MRNCLLCGNKVDSTRKRFCNGQCKNKYWMETHPGYKSRPTFRVECLECGVVVMKSEREAKYCSRKCMWKSDLRKQHISEMAIAENNANWTGDEVGLGALHRWVEKRLPKPEFCENCNKAKPYDLANKGVYNRELINWKWLCRKCHMVEDGRHEKFMQMARRPKRAL